MTNFLTTYFLHSTVLLAAMWLVLWIARPRSPVLAERMWKLAAVLPVITALAMMCRPAGNHSDVRATTSLSDAVEALDVPSISTKQPLEFPTTNDSEVDLFPNSIDAPTNRRMGTLARPHDEDLTTDGTGRSAHPSITLDLSTDVVSSEPIATETAESNPLVIAEPTVVADVAADTPPERAESWLVPAWQVASVLLPIWTAIGAVWLVIRSAWFRWRLRNARRVTRGRTVDLLRELRTHAGQSVGERSANDTAWEKTPNGLATVATKTIRLLIVPGFAEPAAFGVWRPTIVLPPSCEALPREELRAVLAHEFGHIVRGDVWWLLMGRVLTTVLGFQPLNRIARREWTAAAECLCDSWAVDRGVERLTLARCLTALAEHRLTGVSLADALAAVGSPSSLRTRIERLVADPAVDPWAKRSRRWLLSVSVIAAAVVSAVMLPLPKALTASVPRPSGNGLHEGHAQHMPLPGGRGAELMREIGTELTVLRTELDRAERLAEQQSDPQWLDAVEQLRDRERQLVERWRVLMNETGSAQETGTLIDADLR